MKTIFNFKLVKEAVRHIGVGMFVAGILGILLSETALIGAIFAMVYGFLFVLIGSIADD